MADIPKPWLQIGDAYVNVLDISRIVDRNDGPMVIYFRNSTTSQPNTLRVNLEENKEGLHRAFRKLHECGLIYLIQCSKPETTTEKHQE